MNWFEFEVTLPESGEAVLLVVEVWPARRGARDEEGALLEPDEPQEVVIREIRNFRGEPLVLADREKAALQLAEAEAKRRQQCRRGRGTA